MGKCLELLTLPLISALWVLLTPSVNVYMWHSLIALDSYLQRTDLSRVCFDALLSMSQSDEPDIIRSASSQPQTAASEFNVFNFPFFKNSFINISSFLINIIVY